MRKIADKLHVSALPRSFCLAVPTELASVRGKERMDKMGEGGWGRLECWSVAREARDEDEEAIGRWLEWWRVRRELAGPGQGGPTHLGHHWPQISELPFEASGLDGGGKACPASPHPAGLLFDILLCEKGEVWLEGGRSNQVWQVLSLDVMVITNKNYIWEITQFWEWKRFNTIVMW